MGLPGIFLLPGPSCTPHQVPNRCEQCGFEELYKQPDFNRGIGLWLVGFAAVLTVIFAIAGFNWWAIWSPMPAFLIFDFTISKMSSSAVLCYKCEHIHRPKENSQDSLKNVEDFDLEHYDRVHYQDRIARSS